MGAYMMDHLVARERVSALVVMTKSCGPHLELPYRVRCEPS